MSTHTGPGLNSTSVVASSPIAPGDRSTQYEDAAVEHLDTPVYGLLRAGYSVHSGAGRGARIIQGPARISITDKRMARDYIHMLDNRVEVQKAFGLPVDREFSTMKEEAEAATVARQISRRKALGLDAHMGTGSGVNGAMAGSDAGFSPAVMEAIVEVKIDQALSKFKEDIDKRIDGLTAMLNEALTK